LYSLSAVQSFVKCLVESCQRILGADLADYSFFHVPQSLQNFGLGCVFHNDFHISQSLSSSGSAQSAPQNPLTAFQAGDHKTLNHTRRGENRLEWGNAKAALLGRKTCVAKTNKPGSDGFCGWATTPGVNHPGYSKKAR
jgi:hypothetical protein